MKVKATLLLLATALAGPAAADHRVVPDAEREAVRGVESGPTETRGVSGIRVIGTVPLAGELDDPATRVLRAREIVIEPGGQVAVHRHDQRPGIAYILAGEAWEHRNDSPEPILRRAGDAAFERSGVVHWWENRGEVPMRALVVDLVPAE